MSDSANGIDISPPTLSALWRRLWYHLSRRRKIQFISLIILSVVASLMEVFSLGALLPFLGVLVSPDGVFENNYAQITIKFLGIRTANEILLPITLLFMFSVLLASCLRLLLVWTITRFTFAAGADLSFAIYQRTLYQPYATHISRNSSEVISGVTTKSYHLIRNAILPTLTILSSTILIIMIVSALVALRPLVAMFTFVGFASIYLGVVWLARLRLQENSGLIARESINIIRVIQEGLGGIRNVIVDGTQIHYCNTFSSANKALRRAEGSSTFISLSPRLVLEALGIVLIAALAYKLSKQPGGLVTAIPVLGMLALGAQRLMPVLQQIYGAWVSIQSQLNSVVIALDLLDQPLLVNPNLPRPDPLPFGQMLKIREVSFCYAPGTNWVLKSINLSINRGERVGIIGSTGSGKSTLLDIAMGLLTPTQGQILVDDTVIDETNLRAWQANIAHVPQTIYLADCSVEENIAFGVASEDIDPTRVLLSAQRAQVSDVIEAMPQGYKTTVGERGVRLSGGQRQRIGIARAFYKRANIIIFDEATSALDNETEAELMGAVKAIDGDVTVIMIAHRLTTLAICDRVVVLEQGKIKRIGTYAEIVKTP